ncbi:type II toxin-antitoxin system RelE/ParE family toxin [Neochlamydia sp. EPS4]|uniref:type II toxin-antitoxin system RelE/ParE family toxin n=1 Tax=Neochlamydia sp. EPS4 TaxID=1478175 RepID=UPI000693A7AA|nr:type II toxin-antitoxin system RelE/ParE family toxin [Neochlamydia sp. EPS4]
MISISLAESSEQGDVITGTGGIRKARLKSTSKGKRGGFRVCYLNIEDRVILFLLFIYSKNEQENLSQEEKLELKQIAKAIKKGLKMSKLFKGLKKGLEEALAFAERKVTLKSELIEIPEPPNEYKAIDIKRIREKNHYSQGIFAKVLNVSVKTVQSWEAGTRVPSHAALRLLEIVDKGFYDPQIFKPL